MANFTPEEIAERLSRIGGSEAAIIVGDDRDRLTALWLEKRGEADPPNFEDVLEVQIGLVTEALNRAWFTRKTGREVTHAQMMVRSFDHPFMGATLDGRTTTEAGAPAIWQGKHCSNWLKKEAIYAKYYPQMQHEMFVDEREWGVLSVFHGTTSWWQVEVQRDYEYCAWLIEREERFWRCVQTGMPPTLEVRTPPLMPIAGTRKDMTGNNAWADAAERWLGNRAAAKVFEQAKKDVGELAPKDIQETHGHGITAKRAKNGRLTITATDDKEESGDE